jgi:TPR repeat protein
VRATKAIPRAAVIWARCSSEGQGVARDEESGSRLVQRACEQHVQSACVGVGIALIRQKAAGAAERAKALFKTACSAGDANGCYELGVSHWDEGAREEAIKAWRLACKGHVVDGCEAVHKSGGAP